MFTRCIIYLGIAIAVIIVKTMFAKCMFYVCKKRAKKRVTHAGKFTAQCECVCSDLVSIILSLDYTLFIRNLDQAIVLKFLNFT